VTFLANARLWKCYAKHPRQKFSIKVGTIFEDSPIGLDKWLPAMWLIANCKNGISSYELARDLGVTQKTAWFMLHRLRVATQSGTFIKMGGDIECDETYVGGLAKNMHKDKREKKIKGTGGSGKAIVMGILERKGRNETSRVRARVVRNIRKAMLHAEIKTSVEAGSNLYTDNLKVL